MSDDQMQSQLQPRRTDLRIETFEHGNHVLLHSEQDGECRARVLLYPPELEQLIELLASARARLRDVVPFDVDPGTRIDAIADPRWVYFRNGSAQGKVVAFRHPGYGWLPFFLPNAEAIKLADFLTEDLPG